MYRFVLIILLLTITLEANNSYFHKKELRILPLGKLELNNQLFNGQLIYLLPSKKLYLIQYEAGNQNGEIVIWYKSGVCYLRGFTKENQYHNTNTEYYIDGKIKLYEQFKNGKENGVVAYFNKKGNLQRQANYKNGIETEILFDKEKGINSPKAFSKEQLLESIPQSKFHHKKELEFRDGKFYLKEELYIGCIINFEKGVLSIREVLNGVLHGSFKSWSADGKVLSMTKYKNGKKVLKKEKDEKK